VTSWKPKESLRRRAGRTVKPSDPCDSNGEKTNRSTSQERDFALTDNNHLSPEIIAAYLARNSSEEEDEQARRHLLECADCRGDVTEAVELTLDRKPRRWIPFAIPAAAAAIALLMLVPGRGPAPDGTIVRGPAAEGVQQFAAVTPSEGALVDGDSLAFVWKSEGPDVHYVLTVTDYSGDVVWTAATRDTSLVPPREVGFKANGAYFWYVDALLEDARSSTTGVREFTIRP